MDHHHRCRCGCQKRSPSSGSSVYIYVSQSDSDEYPGYVEEAEYTALRMVEKRSFKERLDELPKEKTKAGHGHHDDSEHDSCFSLSSGRHTPDLEEDNSDAENPQQQHVKSRAESCAEKVVYTRRERTASPICIVMSAGSTYSTGHLRCVIKLELTATGDITITKRFGPTTQYFSLADHVHGTLCCGR